MFVKIEIYLFKKRLQSCQTSLELLERYASVSHTNHTFIDELTDAVKKLPQLENGVNAQEHMEIAAVIRLRLFHCPFKSQHFLIYGNLCE